MALGLCLIDGEYLLMYQECLHLRYFNHIGSPLLCLQGGLLNGKEELSLRPQKNFMFKPNTPAMLPRSAQAAPMAPLVPQPGTLSLSPKRLTVDVANPPINPILNKQVSISFHRGEPVWLSDPGNHVKGGASWCMSSVQVFRKKRRGVVNFIDERLFPMFLICAELLS